MTRRGWSCFGVLACLAALCACKATYSSHRIEETIQRMCEKEYGMRVDVQTTGLTLGAILTTPDLLQSDLTLSDRALEKLEHVILTVSRVALSSEPQYDFFVVVIQDPKDGVRVSFVRYLKDVRRLLTDDISRNEYFQRMLIEVSALPVGGAAVGYRLPEYHFGDFLADQIAERNRQQITPNVIITRLFKLEEVEGEYVPLPRVGDHPALSGTIRLRLIFHPGAPPFATLASSTLRDEFLRSFLHTAQTVTRRYDFHAFEGMELVDGSGQRLAYFNRQAFSQDTVNSLMDLIRSLKDKGK